MVFRLAILSSAVVATSAQTSTCVLLENYANAQYTATIGVGTPPQQMKVIPDSGSSDMVLPSAKCLNDGCLGAQHVLFKETNSSTYKGPFGEVDVAYGQGETECQKAKDTVAIGNLKAEKQDMLLITSNGLNGYETAHYDGILGLGPEKDCRKGTGSYLERLPGAAKFTICIGNRNQEKGIIVIGDDTITGLEWKDSLKFPARPIYTGNIPFWGVYMNSVKTAGGDKVDCKPNCAAIIDSGTSLMALPSVMAWSLLDQIGPGYSDDCSDIVGTLPDIVLELEGQKFYMKPKDYMVVVDSDDLTEAGIIKPNSRTALSETTANHIGPFGVTHLRPKEGSSKSSQCAPAFMELDELTNKGQMVILGIPFLRSYATTFERGATPKDNKIHFAQVDGNKGRCSTCSGSDVVMTPTGQQQAEANDDPVQLKMSAVRLPWWATQSKPDNSTTVSQLKITKAVYQQEQSEQSNQSDETDAHALQA